MGDWNTVSRKSKEDHVNQISHSIFITNFPDGISSHDLYNTYAQYGNVIDAYIPSQKSKEEKRFAFVRFIKVASCDILVANLNTIWIGKFRIHANVARFQRGAKPIPKPVSKPTDVRQKARPAVSYVNIVKGNPPLSAGKTMAPDLPALILDIGCLVDKDYSLTLVGKVKEFGSLPNLRVICTTEGFNDVTLRYLGGFWVSLEFQSIIAKEKFLIHEGVSVGNF